MVKKKKKEEEGEEKKKKKNIKKMDKAQIQSQVLKYILITVVSFLIIAFGVVVIKNFREEQREAELIAFRGDISGIGVIATRVGSVDRETFIVPPPTKLICFLDLEKKNEILEMPLVDKYIFIKNSLESSASANVFLITNDVLDDAFYEEYLCFKEYPYYQCIETFHSQLDVFLEGVGDCTTIFTDISEFISYNKRNMSKYNKIEVGGFMAKDEEDHVNYRDLLQIIPLAFVNSRDEGYTQYPYVVYYGIIDDDDIEWIMDEKGINSVIIFRGWYDDEGYGIDGKWVYDDILDNYFSYWDTIYDVTIIAYDNADGALITGLFAAFTNTPLIFINSGNLDDYKEFFKGKNINVVDENLIDSDVIDYIEDNLEVGKKRYFDSDDLRILTHNRILKLDSEIIIPP